MSADCRTRFTEVRLATQWQAAFTSAYPEVGLTQSGAPVVRANGERRRGRRAGPRSGFRAGYRPS